MRFHLSSHPSVGQFLSALILVVPICCNAQRNESTNDWSDALVKWDTQCSPKGCLLMTDVLRGDSGNPPDPKDSREYIGIYVAINRNTQKPAYFAFHVDPGSQQDQGVFVAFTKTTKDGDKWKTGIDADGASRLAFSSCGEDSCVARIPAGIVEEGKESRRMDLLDKFLSSDAVLFLYMKGGKPYRTMVVLSSFKKEYQRVLASELAPPKPTQ
jgi:hypothetical protein